MCSWRHLRAEGLDIEDTARTASEQNIDFVRGGIEAFNARDLDTVLAGVREDVTWERFLSRAETDAPAVRGKDELRAVWESQVQAVDIRVEVLDLVPDGEDRVIASTRMVTRGSGSEIALSAAVTWVFTLDASGLIKYVEVSEVQAPSPGAETDSARGAR